MCYISVIIAYSVCSLCSMTQMYFILWIQASTKGLALGILLRSKIVFLFFLVDFYCEYVNKYVSGGNICSYIVFCLVDILIIS